jgi:CheY-like chemotaxis protein
VVVVAHEQQRAAIVHLVQGLGAKVVGMATAAEALALCRQRANDQAAPYLVLSDEAGVADAEFAAWLTSAEKTTGSPPLILAWRQHIVQPAAWPQAKLIGRPVMRRPLLQAILASQGRLASENTAPVAHHADFAGARILVVDDYALNIEIVTAYLHEANCAVTVAHDGREALDCLLAGEFDAVLMDCQMPVMDGYDATRAIRQEPRWQQLPVIAMTANVMQGDREKCFVSGMNDFVPKPIIVDQLFAVLGKQLQGRPRAVRVESGPTTVPAGVAANALPAPPFIAASASTAAVDLTKLVNVDVDAALQSTMGLPGFLARVLRIFLTTQKDFDVKFAQALADRADPEAAGRAAHTLKGAAASIGAQALREAALVLEQACKRAAPEVEVQTALDAVMKEMLPVVGGVEAALGSAENSAEKVGSGGTAVGAK